MNNKRLYGGLIAALLIGAVVRLGLIGVANDIIDVQNFQNVATTVRDKGVFALYVETSGWYPYPPLWVWFAMAAHWLDEIGILPFSWGIRLPSFLVDLGFIFIFWHWWAGIDRQHAEWLAFLHALNPVVLIVTYLHGQFDVIPAFLTGLALLAHRSRHIRLAAIALGIAIAFKPYPILFLPIMLFHVSGRLEQLIYALLASMPTAILLSPFWLHAPEAVAQQVFRYQGVPLLGFMTVLRSIYVFQFSDHFPVGLTHELIRLSRWVFLSAYTLLLLHTWRQKLSPVFTCTATLALFYTLYGGISPQYLFWIMPFLLMLPIRPWIWPLGYIAVASLALVGFYGYAVPATVQPIVQISASIAPWFYGAGGSLLWFFTLSLVFWLLSRSTISQGSFEVQHDPVLVNQI